MDINRILTAGLILLAEYRAARDKVIAAGDPTATDGSLKTDEELINLMKLDAIEADQHIAELLKKHGA